MDNSIFKRTYPGQYSECGFFFMTSGMLVSLGFFEYVTKTGTFNIFLFYLHRYLRITLPLALVVLFYTTLAHFLGTGPILYNVYKEHQKYCQDYWWSTLLHIQAYVNPDKLVSTDFMIIKQHSNLWLFDCERTG